MGQELRRERKKEMLKRKVKIIKLRVSSKGQEKVKQLCLYYFQKGRDGDVISFEFLFLGGVIGIRQFGGFEFVGGIFFWFEVGSNIGRLNQESRQRLDY